LFELGVIAALATPLPANTITAANSAEAFFIVWLLPSVDAVRAPRARWGARGITHRTSQASTTVINAKCHANNSPVRVAMVSGAKRAIPGCVFAPVVTLGGPPVGWRYRRVDRHDPEVELPHSFLGLGYAGVAT
jgi:hypothetical protein